MAQPAAIPRSLLFVPGHRQSMLAKAAERGADAVVLDLEDSVPPAEKETARSLVGEALKAWPAGSVSARFVRINPPRAGMVRLDAEVLAGHDDVVVVVPKVDRAIELAAVRDALPGRAIVVNIETPRSIQHADELADYPDVVGLFLGGEDLTSALGMRRTPHGHELDHARWQVLLSARAAGIAAWDTICPEFRDLDVLAHDCETAARMGFDGKFAIHPAQVPVIHRAFSPSTEEAERAARIVDAFDRAVHEGLAAVEVDGQMVDPPVAERARAILRRSDWGGR